MDSLKVDSTHIRICFGDTEQLWAYFSQYDQVLLAKEVSSIGKVHHHVMVGGSYFGRDKVSNEFREQMCKAFRLKGNKDYSISCVKDVEKCIAYLLKDGDFRHKGHSESSIETLKKISYAKYDKKVFATKLASLNDEYLKGKLDDRGWISSYLALKLSYNQFNVNKNYVVNLFRSLKLKKDSAFFSSFVTEILSSANVSETEW